MPLLDEEMSLPELWKSGAKEGMFAKGEGLIPFYPNQRYLKRKWAPEQIPAESLIGIKRARDRAVKAGVLGGGLGDQFVSNLLVEGRGGGPGVIWDDDLRRPVEVSREIPVSFGVLETTLSNLSKKQISQLEKMGVPHPDSWGDTEWEDPEMLASVAAVVLADKASRYGEDKAIERWNGVGPLARNHAAKVKEMGKMLKHPQNKGLRGLLGID